MTDDIDDNEKSKKKRKFLNAQKKSKTEGWPHEIADETEEPLTLFDEDIEALALFDKDIEVTAGSFDENSEEAQEEAMNEISGSRWDGGFTQYG